MFDALVLVTLTLNEYLWRPSSSPILVNEFSPVQVNPPEQLFFTDKAPVTPSGKRI